MLKGKVKVIKMTHANGAILKAGQDVSEKDVGNFLELVEKGCIELDKKSKAELKKQEKEAKELADKKKGLLRLAETELKAKCEDQKIDIPEGANKNDLVGLLLNS